MGGRGSTKLAFKYPDMFCSLFNQAGNVYHVTEFFDSPPAEGYREYLGTDKQRYIDAAVLSPEEIAAIRCPVLLMHGRDDQPVPLAETALPLAAAIDHADLMIIARCGHSPALEHPETFVAIAEAFFGLGPATFGDS